MRPPYIRVGHIPLPVRDSRKFYLNDFYNDDLTTYSYTCTIRGRGMHHVCKFFKYFPHRSASSLSEVHFQTAIFFCSLSDVVQTLWLSGIVGIWVCDTFLSNCVYRNIASACCYGTSWAVLGAAWRCLLRLESTVIIVKLCKNTNATS